VAQLCQIQEQLSALDTRVIIISFGTLPAAHAWLKETCVTFEFLLDPERSVYQAYGLERSLIRSWTLRTLWVYLKLLAAGRKWRGIQGDANQLGGDFIVGKDGKIRLAYRSHDPSDRPAVEDLLKVLGDRSHLSAVKRR
jgi:peroxiredoxin